MQIFNSGFFWFVEGALVVLMLLAVRAWAVDRSIRTTWWKWLALVVWMLFAGFTFAFIGTSLGENEPTAAFRGGLLFGVVLILSGVGLWRLWLMRNRSDEMENVAES
jgi:hypothetical protein